MNQFDKMFARIKHDPPSRELRLAVLDLIAACLEQTKHSLGYWEKENIAGAIAALAWNLTSNQSVTDAWLRLSVVRAEKTLVPKEQRDEEYGRKDDAVDSLTYQQFKSTLEQLQHMANQ